MWPYLANLNAARQALWCYLIWYLVIGARYFDASLRLWLTSLGIAGVVGLALWLSVTADGSRVGGWALFRLFLMPFCVSSFAALVKGHGFVLVFSPQWMENAAGLGLCGLFLLLVRLAKMVGPRPVALVLATVLILFREAPCAAAEAGPDAYAKDVDFLLTELPKQAGRFFQIKGIDWPAVSNESRAEVQSVTNDAQHVKLCQRLLARLRDGHARLTDLKVALPDEAKGRRWTGPRVHLMEIGERVFVRQAFGTAADKGIETGMEVLRIDDLPAREWLTRRVAKARDETGYSTEHQARYAACHWGLGEWEGTRISFVLAKGGTTNTVTITRQGGPNFVPTGPVFPPKNLKGLGRQSYGKTAGGFGYIHLRDVPGNLPDQLDTMLEAIGDVPGLVLDMRANGGGGCDHDAVFGRFVATGQTWRRYPSAGKKPFGRPMVVIVDAGTRSAGETVGGMFKEDGRAFMIGDSPTAGTSSSKTTLPVPSGLFAAYFSIRSNMQRFNGGRGIEGLGVPPHETVPYDPAELAQGVDTQIRRAEELLKRGLPKDQVPYEAGGPR